MTAMHFTITSTTQPVRNGNGRRVPPGAPIVLRRRYRCALGVLLVVVLIVGCAQQYHWYDCGCGCVNYNYCPPGPLPYSPYCTCPTPIAESYRFKAGQQGAEETGAEETAPDDLWGPQSARSEGDTAWTLLPY
jgi:hypothetical protein